MFAIENPSVRRSEAESECQMTTRIAHLEGLYRVRSTCERSAPLKAARVGEMGGRGVVGEVWWARCVCGARWWAVVL